MHEPDEDVANIVLRNSLRILVEQGSTFVHAYSHADDVP